MLPCCNHVQCCQPLSSGAPHQPPAPHQPLHLTSHQVGTFETDPAAIAGILKRWFGPQQEEFRAMGERSLALGRPEAVYKISRDLADMVREHRLALQPLMA